MSRLAEPHPSGRAAPVGMLLRRWRQRRRRSQMDLALDAEVSPRHVSFVESGRSVPSRDLLLRLADTLAVPLRERNALLLAAGYAPVFAERTLDDPGMQTARRVVDTILSAHLPHPALAMDRHWQLLAANDAVSPLLDGVTDPGLLQLPVNLLRLSLAPGGLAPSIANLPVWRDHLLDRLRRQAAASADPVLLALLEEFVRTGEDEPALHPGQEIALPLELDTRVGRLSLLSTTTVFGTPLEVTLSELAIEAFYPADPVTAERLRRLAGNAPVR